MTTITLPELAIGERYAGLILDADAKPIHHLILLPGEAERATWKKAKEFAEAVGGELPTRQEQALLYANAKAEFKPDWYWSSETHASISDYAWMQYFDNGGQDFTHEDFTFRARAVRRLAI